MQGTGASALPVPRTPGLPQAVSAQALFDASPDGLLVLDRHGIILAVNESLVAMLGYPRAALVGVSLERLVPPAVRDRHRGQRRAYAVSAAQRRVMGGGLDLHAVAAGGDLLPVDVMLAPLPSAGRGCVLLALRDVRHRRSREADWEHRALHDPLTGVANRSLVLDRLEQACLRAARSGDRIAVFFLDLDGFKLVNDRHGHAAGDAVLVVTAQRLEAETRPTDAVGRVGGDEFVVVVEESRGPADDEVYAERLRAALVAPMSISAQEVRVGCSIGCAVWEPGTDWSTLLKLADRAMFRDKARRRMRAG